jgi:hypothetical protein
MDEIISAILKSIMELEGKKSWKLVAWVIVILGIVLALEPKTHFLYFLSSIGTKRDIEMMFMLLELEKDGVLDSANLKDDYLKLVESYRKQRHFTVIPTGVFQTLPSSPREQLYKFASGTLLLGFIGLAYLFSAKKIPFRNRIGGFVLMLLLAAILGLVAMLIPTFYSPWINYIGMPILQLLLLVWAAVVSTRKQREKDAAKIAEDEE